MGSQDLTDIPMMKAVLVLSVFIAQAFGQTAECNPPMPSECAEGDISCDMGSYADCWMGDFCMPEGSECPPSCNTPAPSMCEGGEVMCVMGVDATGCWMGDYCMARDPSVPLCATLLFPLSVPPLISLATWEAMMVAGWEISVCRRVPSVLLPVTPLPPLSAWMEK